MAKASSSQVIGTCGLGVLYNFSTRNGRWSYKSNITSCSFGGIGYNVAGFVNTRICKRVYEEINEYYEIVFQSPVKKNTNSNRKFFFIIFKRKENK